MRAGAVDMAITEKTVVAAASPELNRVNTLPFHMRMKYGDTHE